jgi:hypothetical protein
MYGLGSSLQPYRYISEIYFAILNGLLEFSLSLFEFLISLPLPANVSGVLIVRFAAPSDLADGILYLGNFPR